VIFFEEGSAMTEEKKVARQTNEGEEDVGSVRIADEVISIIAGLAATEVPGVAGMSGGLVGGIAELLGKKNLSKGVRVRLGDKEASIDLYVILEYGINIPDAAVKIQEKVKEAVENMSGMEVVEINIHVQGISNLDKLKEKQSKDIVE
jgi:uncharacterized alkaline shock family protein YloU